MNSLDPSSPVKEDAGTMGFGCSEDELLASKLIDFDCLSRGRSEKPDIRQHSSSGLLSTATSFPYAGCLYTGLNDEDFSIIPEWHLFSGTSFALGESIVANTFLPIWSSTESFKLPDCFSSPMMVNDSGVEMKSRSITSSEFSEIASSKDPSSPVKEDAGTMGFGCSEDELLASKLIDFDCLSRGRSDKAGKCYVHPKADYYPPQLLFHMLDVFTVSFCAHLPYPSPP
ncbi:unnamed protein product [Strongylus vulgaris]|uniref:Uncharacterized protein n=1 Tax=Strongylus vulgaris TaxID=40348 RepID=A0A3P7JA76_STRVU|nr:unnamed protein product [Strongylus vulgaris]